MTAHDERRGALTVKHQPGDILIELFSDQGENVADVYVYPGGEQAAFDLAHQMAAAPLLVEALRKCEAVLSRIDTLRHISPQFPALDLARAADLAQAALDAARAPERSEEVD